MDQLVAMSAFVRVAQCESFQEAARLEGLAQGTISKRVAALEKHLGTQLLRRNQRGITLTALGETYLKHCLQILEDVSAADALIMTDAGTPAGTVRLSMSPVLSRLVLAPILVAFCQEYPKIQVASFLTEDHIDIVGEGIDVAVRARQLEDSALIASRLSSNPLTLAAAPSYLEQAGRLEQPEDLTNHDCIVFSRMRATQTWRLTQGRKVRDVAVSGTFTADQGDTLVEYAANGAGIVMMPEWVMAAELESGRLVRVLLEWEPPSIPLHIVFSSSAAVPLRTRLLVDFIRREVRSKGLLSR